MKNALFLLSALLLATATFLAGKQYSANPVEKEAVVTQLKPLLEPLGISTMAITYYAHCTPPDFVLTVEELVVILQNNVILRDQLGGHLRKQNPEMSEESIAEFVRSAAFGLQRQTINSLNEAGACTEVKWRKMNDYLKDFAKQDLQKNIPEADKAIILPTEVVPILTSIKNS